jgi:3-hydroxybutyrate dehydrogenase
MDLTGKTVVITGASQGIGAAIAEVFADSNANLILLSRNEKKLSTISQKLSAKYHILDVSNEDQVKKVFSEIEKIDILINNAGVYFTSPVAEIDTKKWKELLDVNLNGAMYCTRSALPIMIKNNFGRIINISSISGKTGDPYGSAYCASKFALIGFTQSLAQEVARNNITANCICPGWVETKMAEDILHDEKYAKLIGIKKEDLKTSSLEAVPIGRYVHPKEVGYLALYLASDYANAITGQAINIDGGLCMH